MFQMSEFSGAEELFCINQYINYHVTILAITMRTYFVRLTAGKLKWVTSLNVEASGFL
jgi:hypothetical protein